MKPNLRDGMPDALGYVLRFAAPLRLNPRRLFEYNGQRHHPLVQ